MKFKRGLFFIGLTAMVAVLAAGCGRSAKGASDKQVSLAINYYNGAISKAAIANTKAQFPKYKLQFKQVPSNEDFDTKLKASLGAKSAPDITAINDNIDDYLPYKDKFVNLQDYGTKDLAKDYVDWKWQSTFGTKGYQIAMPIDIGPTALMYNVAAFKKAGLPTDPEQVSAMIKTDADYMKAADQVKTNAKMPMFLSTVALFEDREQKVTKDLFKNGKLSLADGQLKAAWDFAIAAHEKGYTLDVKNSGSDSVNAQQKGLFGAMIKPSWSVEDLKENGVKPGEWLVAAAPGAPSNAGGSYLAALKTTAHPKEAAEVIKYLTNEKNQRANFKELSLFPSNKKAYDDKFKATTNELFGDEQYNKYFIESANKRHYFRADPRSSAVQRIFEDQMQLIQDQNKKPAQAWQDAVKKAQQVD